MPVDSPTVHSRRMEFQAERVRFVIVDHIETRRGVGRNWVAQYPALAAAVRDRGKDDLAISAEEEPWKYICWAGCKKEKIRAALGPPIPVHSRILKR